jgi:sulfate/thiosulfate transport system permease protein
LISKLKPLEYQGRRPKGAIAPPATPFSHRVSLPWAVTIAYLVVMLLLPISALLTKSISVGPMEFWRIATSPVARSAYEVTFVTALAAGSINGVMGTLVAWVLVRYKFPGRKLMDAAVDLPFALPTAVAGLVLATLYSDKGWIGQLFAPFGIKIAFTRLGVLVAMIFISLPFVVPFCKKWSEKRKKPPGLWAQPIAKLF